MYNIKYNYKKEESIMKKLLLLVFCVFAVSSVAAAQQTEGVVTSLKDFQAVLAMENVDRNVTYNGLNVKAPKGSKVNVKAQKNGNMLVSVKAPSTITVNGKEMDFQKSATFTFNPSNSLVTVVKGSASVDGKTVAAAADKGEEPSALPAFFTAEPTPVGNDNIVAQQAVQDVEVLSPSAP
jgi:outer membrane lipoprotein-sorting protein